MDLTQITKVKKILHRLYKYFSYSLPNLCQKNGKVKMYVRCGANDPDTTHKEKGIYIKHGYF